MAPPAARQVATTTTAATATEAPRGGAGKGAAAPLRRGQLRARTGGRAVVMVRVGEGWVGIERKKQGNYHFKLNHVKIIVIT